MNRPCLAVAAILLAGSAGAEVRGDHIVIGPEQIWIEVIDPVEIMWVGRNEFERTQVLSGADVEIVAFTDDAESVALLGTPALVAKVTGTHSCETGDATLYYVVPLGEVPAAEGPVSTCVALTVSFADGAVVLEEDPVGEGEFWAWTPGKGFSDRLE